MGLKFARLKNEDGEPCVKMPKRAGKVEAGIDFFVPDNFSGAVLRHGDSILIPLGIKVKLPEVPECLSGTHEYMLELKNKSGIGYKKGLVVGSCVIDSSYQGEVCLNLHNNTHSVKKPGCEFEDNDMIIINPNDKIVQGVLILVNTEEIEECDEDSLFDEETQRGEQGFGSDYQEIAES